MFSTLAVVLPIFALVLVGWVVRRFGALGPHATGELNRFVIRLALPALLFHTVAHARWADLWQPGFIATFGLSTLALFALPIVVGARRSRHLADATIDGLNASYTNAGFIGFPLILVALGREALPPTTIAVVMTCSLFAVAIVLIELGLQGPSGRWHLAGKAGRTILFNPLVLAPLLGAAVPLGGLEVPGPAERFLVLLGDASAPCALVALGLFLAGERSPSRSEHGRTGALIACKLVAHPALAWVLAAFVFHLPPALTHAAVLLTALPTGTGPFILAEFYDREAAVTSNVVLVSTLISVLTVTGYLRAIA